MNQPFYYSWDETTKILRGKEDAQVDPLESQAAGHDVYCGLPLNATYEVPPEAKDGFDIVMGDNGWEYKESEKEPESEPYVPTERDKLLMELYDCQAWLNKHDYIGTKIATGRATADEYADEIAQMTEYASRIESLREQIAEMDTQVTTE